MGKCSNPIRPGDSFPQGGPVNEHFYALIMAGGGGTRLWPLSRRQHPKQMLTLVGDRSLFQLAVDRLLPLLPPERILVVTASQQVAPLAAQVPQIPEANFIIEPLGRGTAPCIGLAALHLQQRDPYAVMAVVTADHYIRHVDTFHAALLAARLVADQGYLVTLGIEPTYPATGYGYIRRGEALGSVGDLAAFRVAQFAEKPDSETALRFLATGDYAWNSGMFIWQVHQIMREFSRWMPDFAASLTRLEGVLGTPEYDSLLAQLWPAVAKQTIDYGIMEKADRVAVLPVDLGWSDVGAWPAVMNLHTPDSRGNVVHGDVVVLDTSNTMVFSSTDRLIATIGLQDLVILDSEGVTLVAAREQAERVREIVETLQRQGRDAFL